MLYPKTESVPSPLADFVDVRSLRPLRHSSTRTRTASLNSRSSTRYCASARTTTSTMRCCRAAPARSRCRRRTRRRSTPKPARNRCYPRRRRSMSRRAITLIRCRTSSTRSFRSLHIVTHRCTSLHIVTHRDQDQLYALIRASAYRHVPLLAVHAHSHARAQPPSERDQRQLR